MISKVDDIIASELQQLNVTRSTDVGPSQPDPSNNMRPDPVRKCLGCGGIHGSVGAGINCLEAALTVARRAHEPCLRLRREVAALAPSHVKARGR